MEFIDFANRHRIIILILPPHSTHKLQPLDIGIFQTLSTNYSIELDNMIAQGQGFTHISKRLFFRIYKKACDLSFTKEAIQRAFEKPGIWPIYRDEMIQAVSRPKSKPKPSSSSPKTLKTTAKVRRFHITYFNDPSFAKVAKLFKALDHTKTQTSILSHENQNLQEAILIE